MNHILEGVFTVRGSSLQQLYLTFALMLVIGSDHCAVPAVLPACDLGAHRPVVEP